MSRLKICENKYPVTDLPGMPSIVGYPLSQRLSQCLRYVIILSEFCRKKAKLYDERNGALHVVSPTAEVAASV